MFSLVKLVFIILLIFISSLARDRTNFVSLDDELCMIRPTLISSNTIELKYYPLMISLDKCNGSCNVLSPRIYVLKKDKNIKVIKIKSHKCLSI